MTTLEKEIAAFSTLIERELARLIEIVQKATPGLHPQDRERVARCAIRLAWRDREFFEPGPATSFPQWFSVSVRAALSTMSERFDLPQSVGDEQLLQSLGLNGPPVVETRFALFLPEQGEGKPELDFRTEAPQIVGEECPPCWRCRYFDGWLPVNENRTAEYNSELGTVCMGIDLRKVQIAHEVRERYSPELLGLDEEQSEL